MRTARDTFHRWYSKGSDAPEKVLRWAARAGGRLLRKRRLKKKRYAAMRDAILYLNSSRDCPEADWSKA